ncbi:MAG: DUF975 family protein [Candidatus Cloacimonetes bacterium]|nr:DUF975 family protein [Candidatus Cloacimonadota bacterium]
MRLCSLMTGKWGTCAVTLFVYYLLIMGLSFVPVVGSVGSIILSGPFSLGLAIIFLRVSRDESIDIAMLFKGFDDFMRSFVAGLLVAIYTLLWTLLLIIPGIIVGISYSQTFFILSENPTLTPSEAIQRSKEMMQGHKSRFFMLSLSFIGWFILGVVTMGIAFLWIGSYYSTALAVFYLDLKNESIAEDTEFTGFVPSE